MKIPFKYTFRSFKSRKLTAIITVTGIALVVFVFAAALMMAYGVEKLWYQPVHQIILKYFANLHKEKLQVLLTAKHRVL